MQMIAIHCPAKSIAILTLTILLLISACGRGQDEPEEPESPRPTADQIFSEQPSLHQDESEDERDDVPADATEPADIAEPRHDLSHITSREPIAAPVGLQLIGTYTGTLPCADCAGIEHELSLYEDRESRERRYTLSRTYLATRDGDQTFFDAGPWRITSTADAGRVFDLNFQSDEERIRFEVASERVIRLLGRDGQPIGSNQNYSLYRLPGN